MHAYPYQLLGTIAIQNALYKRQVAKHYSLEAGGTVESGDVSLQDTRDKNKMSSWCILATSLSFHIFVNPYKSRTPLLGITRKKCAFWLPCHGPQLCPPVTPSSFEGQEAALACRFLRRNAAAVFAGAPVPLSPLFSPYILFSFSV